MSAEVDALRGEVARLARMERRMELLLAVSGELASARTSADVARIVVDQGFAAVGASYGALWTIDRDARELRLLAVSKLPRGDIARWRLVPLDTDAPVPEVARSGEAIFLDTLAAYRARFAASFERIRETISSPDAAYAAVPVAADGPPIAVFALTYEPPSELDPGERTFLSILARQCGLALARVRLIEELERACAEERDAHLTAEDAARAREEILSVVSHDLRNPLGTILMGAATLLTMTEAGDPKAERVRAVTERIHRQSERMARFIDDLVDFAVIQNGKLAIARAPAQPAAVLAAAAEVIAPYVRERGPMFEVLSAPQLPAVDCDAQRAVQAFSNLVTNALKVTPKSGTISIGARPGDREVVFYVRDSGPGIDADELPRLFDRYWRSKKTSYRGAGLGLAIAKGIVEAHGGRIWAEASGGVGTTFLFTLQPAISRTSGG